jgi:hydroxyquinol 1,2-dioxygenase
MNTQDKEKAVVAGMAPLTAQVIASFAATSDARLRCLLGALVRHLHEFVRAVELSDEEWRRAIEFLTAAGRCSQGGRQELVLLSDVLGLSTLLVRQNHAVPLGATEATVMGPFYLPDVTRFSLGDDIANGAPGTPCTVSGMVRDVAGSPLANATVEVWQADGTGHYDVQLNEGQRNRGVLQADEAGAFNFRTVVAEPYPVPTDGPVGDLLRSTGRSAWRPGHLHVRISAVGYETLTTHVFRHGDPYLESDAVFGVRNSLIAAWQPQSDGTYALHFDFVLSGQRNG